LKKIQATKPYFNADDISYITEKFKEILSGKSFLSQYKYCAQFEQEFASYTGTDFAVSCNSGTSALELIFRALDVQGKEVILPSNTFIATANAIMNAGGIPVFADCDESMCLDFKDTINKITPETIAICHVHIGGLVSDNAMRLAEYCKNNKIYFVEDAAQAHGSINQNRKAGTLGIASGFSFFSTKVMTTGEGGMVTTNDENMVIKMKSIREFGKEKQGIFTNYHTSLGYNWRMPEVAALMGIRQLQSIERFIEKRVNIAKIYDEMLGGINDVIVINPSENSRFNYFKYILVIKNMDREIIHKFMENKGIQLSGYIYELPLHKQPVFHEYQNCLLPNSEYYCSKHICLPIYPSLEIDDAKYIADTLLEIIAQ
jgi:perosamine synthetase